MAIGSKRSVLILATGGTIAMRHTPAGLALDPEFPEVLERRASNIARDQAAGVRINHLQPAIDSANATPDTPARIARAVRARIGAASYRGVVVLHGTDTLAYTASRLGFELAGCGVPVVLTGSQLPHGQVGSDAWPNLTLAIRAALKAAPHSPVCVAFGGELLPGVRTQKLHSSALKGFGAARQLELPAPLLTPSPRDSCERLPGIERPLTPRTEPARVVSLRVTPGLGAAELTAIAAGGCDGLVLECYGAGTAPTASPGFAAALAEIAASRPVVAVTQCAGGGVELGRYQSAEPLVKAGVISGADMTVEAAIAKLSFLLDAGCDLAEVRRIMPQNLVGECGEHSGHSD